jgi:hypothetical protein
MAALKHQKPGMAYDEDLAARNMAVGLPGDRDLAAWVACDVDFARSLPARG